MSATASGAWEFDRGASIIVITDGAAALGRCVTAAEAIGARIVDAVGLDGAGDRIGRQADLDMILIDVEGGDEDAIAELFAKIAAFADGRALVVNVPMGLVGLADAMLGDGPAQLLCGADEIELVAALASASRRARSTLHEVRQSDPDPRLIHIAAEVGRIARTLADLSIDQPAAARSPAQSARGHRAQPAGRPLDAGRVRDEIRRRKLRARFFDPDLFGDPAWDMLLDLMAARIERQSVAVSSLCIAAGVPPTTALRWIKAMTERGMFVRRADPDDRRRIFIELGEPAAGAMEQWFAACGEPG